MTQQPEGDESLGTSTRESTAAPEVIGETLRQLTSSARVGAVFGEPQTVGNRTVIPAAEVFCSIGFGMGAGGGRGKEGSEAGYGSGGGGGGMARSRPIAAIVVEPEGVFVRPIVDWTQVYLAALAAGVSLLFWARKWHWGRPSRLTKLVRDHT